MSKTIRKNRPDFKESRKIHETRKQIAKFKRGEDETTEKLFREDNPMLLFKKRQRRLIERISFTENPIMMYVATNTDREREKY